MRYNEINLVDTIDSGQVFLWSTIKARQKGENTHREKNEWYGVNGQNILKVYMTSDYSNDNIIVKSYHNGRWYKDTSDLFRNKDDIRNNITRSLPNDNTIKTALSRYPGLRIMRQDPFQCTISFITSANSNIQRIRTNLTKITQKFGKDVTVNNIGKMHLFPTPDVLAKASVREVEECGVGYRAKYIVKASEMVASKDINYDEIMQMENYYDALNAMCKIPGVGNKVADCILLFSLNRSDAFPLDRWMIRILSKYYGNILDIADQTQKVTALTDKQYKTIHEKIVQYFGPNAGYAQQWLFKMARDDANAAWL